MAFNLEALRRRLKPSKRQRTLSRRSDDQLPFVGTARVPPGGARILLDTCVYLDTTADRIPDTAIRFLAGRQAHHSTVCVSELTFGLGSLKPDDPRSSGTGALLAEILAGIVSSPRLIAPDAEVWATAGMLAGILARTQGYGTEQRRKALTDALLFATARKLGLVLLTANLAEFDPMLQLLPETQAAFYRPA